MKIAQLVSNFHRVAADSNQAIYSHVAWLTNGLVETGNDVTLFAASDSESKARLSGIGPATGQNQTLTADQRKHLVHLLISKCYEKANEFDVIHSHFNLLSAFYSKLVSTPTVQSFHSPIDPGTKEILKNFQDNSYISFSLAQRKQMPELNWIANIYHGVDMGKFAFNPQPKDYFLYLGRITEEKGVHFAIEAARTADVPLIIAGRSYPTEGYWHEKIEKQIDGKQIKYVGEANFQAKIELLQNAKAVLFPTQYDEVFGLVMIEAQACGTPVIGWNKGSVAEVVEDGHTGHIVKDVKDMVKSIKLVDKINREACRDRAVKLFSVEKMVSGYEKVYLRIMEENRKGKPNNHNGHNEVTRM